MINIYTILKIFIFSIYFYLFTPNWLYVISYITHKTIDNNFINLVSGIVCLRYIDIINHTILNNYYIINGLIMIMLYLSFIEIIINVFLLSINTIILLIKFKFLLKN